MNGEGGSSSDKGFVVVVRGVKNLSYLVVWVIYMFARVLLDDIDKVQMGRWVIMLAGTDEWNDEVLDVVNPEPKSRYA